MILEICANSYTSAFNAEKAGAHRIELCQELSLGGITPSHGLLEKVCSNLSIEVYVLIRPRSGDFTFTDDEFDVMLRDIAFAKTLGCNGIVSGVLYRDGTIDKERTAQLKKAAGEMDFTFHRAFDWTPDYEKAIQTLKEIGIGRVLTSGQNNAAAEGFENLKKMKKLAGPNVSIMPGGGINPENIKRFIEAGFVELHSSASSTSSGYNRNLIMHNVMQIASGEHTYSDIEKIKRLLERAQS